MLNYDPDNVPAIAPQAYLHACEMGLHPIHVICDEPGATEEAYEGVSFISYACTPPRPGDRIELQDGKTCEVRRVFWRTSTHPNYRMVLMIPNVYSVRISE